MATKNAIPTSEFSPAQYFQRAKTCPTNELDSVLQEIATVFPSFANQIFVRILVKHRGMQLHLAYEKLRATGFEVSHKRLQALAHYFRTRSVPPRWLHLPDFELILSLREHIDDGEMQEWFGLQFLSYWQSPCRPALSGETLQRMRPLWGSLRPTKAAQLAPANVCGLGWSKKDTCELLETLVDMNDDAAELARELLQRGFLTPELMNSHQGLIGALLRVDQHWVVERVLLGEVVLHEPQPSVALSLLRALDAVLGDPARPALTKQQCLHLSNFLASLEHVEKASNMMNQGLEATMRLVAKVKPKERGQLLSVVSKHFLEKEQQPGGGCLSRQAEVPNPQEPGWEQQDRTSMLHVYERFLEKVIQFVSLEEFVTRVAPLASHHAGAGLSSKFHRWALTQLEHSQSAEIVLSFFGEWVLNICNPEQVT
ncbi:hypothetical protein CYMTET_55044 [Cymbomonas tetramitiformis]|uniref:Uncharacterized protein n=1 Tax=Cymbomonas tetramitiformis TaxID=36881 RepID=A0AAE0EN52_9CHLO|nr:hypothetical protein CYMTET_55044 [Cymbomonas tetramitiformis]